MFGRRYFPVFFAAAAVVNGEGNGFENGPNYLFCGDHVAKMHDFCDHELDLETRVENIVANLTLREMASMMSPDRHLGSDCNCHTSGVSRLGIPSYMWLVETNTDVSGDCFGDKCRTELYGPLGHGATFNRTAWEVKGRILSTEVRAMRNAGWWRDVGRTVAEKKREKIGLTVFGPNLNIARDPRFGRLSELPGEDPFLNGELGAAMVKAMQEEDERGRPRVLAFLKHFTAYSVETNRGMDTHNISKHDLFDTYLRQFEIAVTKGRPAGSMSSYNGVNGIPLCANSFLMEEVYRKKWGSTDAIFATDCGAVSNLMHQPLNLQSIAQAAAFAVGNGTDIELGSDLIRNPQGLRKAVKLGYIDPEKVRCSVRRLHRALLRVGLYDPFGFGSHDELGETDIQSEDHIRLAHENALQAPVLLKNDNDVLPLSTDDKIALIGPLADHGMGLVSSYVSKPVCPGPPDNDDCIVTFRDVLKGENVFFAEGLSMNDIEMNKTKAQKSLEAVNSAEKVVMVLGNSNVQEREGLDRAFTDLMPAQEQFAHFILENKRGDVQLIIILVNGGPLSIEWLDSATAVIEAFNPNNRGVEAIGELMYGVENRWGKLPYTIYPSSFQNEACMFDFSMSMPPGRTYRYYTGKPSYPFGFGLTYTTFEIQACHCSPKRVECEVKNSGNRQGDEVIQIYHIAPKSDKVPNAIQTLVAFERVSIAKEAVKSVSFRIGHQQFLTINQNGEKELRPGNHVLKIKLGSLGGSAHDTIYQCEFKAFGFPSETFQLAMKI